MGRVATFRRWARPAALIALYVAAAEITDGLTLESGFSPWYPPAGIALAYLVVVGPRGAATVLAGRFLSIWVAAPEAWRNEPDGVIVRALAIVGCAAAGAHVLRRVRLEHVRLRELAWFVGVGVVAVPLGAALSVAAVSVLLLGEGGRAAFAAARTVWVGDAIAVATIAPAALLVVADRAGAVRSRPVTSGRADRIETVLQVVALVGAPVVALAIAEELDATAFLCLAVLPVIWVAVRGNLVFAAIGLLVVNVTLTAFAALALENTARLSELQVVMLAAALGALYVVVVSHSQDALVAELAESEGRLRTIVENVPCTIVRFDLDGGVRFASQPCQDGDDASLMVEGLQATWPTLIEPIAGGEVVEHQWQARTRDGARWFSARLGGEHRADGTLQGVVAMISDLTPKHQAEAELARERWEDRLTGLANRRRFLDLLGPLAAREGGALAIAVIDIDGFSRVNDGIGHEGADDVLREVSERLARRAGTRGVAARLGGDEFALALPVASLQSAHGLAQELLEELRITVPLGERSLLVTGSVGVARDASGAAGVDLLYDAESALHTAKEAGGGRAAAFEVGRRLATLERGARLTLVREALDNESIVVHYQPIVELDSGEILSVEALVRLPDPVSGQLLPRRRAAHPGRGEPAGGRRSRNVTARELVEPEFVPQLLEGVQSVLCARRARSSRRGRRSARSSPASSTRSMKAPGSVSSRHTDRRTVTADLAAATRALTQLRTHGVQAALDDFGMGYSSMAYLRRLPVDVLKIDRSFVAGLPDDPDDAAIVSLIVGLSSALGLDVTAEGIETDEQRDALLALGCRRGQGFLFARPMDAAAIADRLAAPLVGGA